MLSLLRWCACWATLLLLPGVWPALHISDLPGAESDEAGLEPFGWSLGGFDKLVPFVLPSPNQEGAGSCLYMATTGVAEWWLARLNPTLSRAPDGPLDLSERHLMNLAGGRGNEQEDKADLPNWRTDSIYLFNQNGGLARRNTADRFTKGWYFGNMYSERILPAARDTVGAAYGTLFNWILSTATPDPSATVQLPVFERKVIFADPARDKWNVGVAPDDIVDTVKAVLREREAPVLVMYNHHRYWHVVFIVGYNDDMDNGNCAYTETFRTRIAALVGEMEQRANEGAAPAAKQWYKHVAAFTKTYQAKLERAYATGGGCTSNRGVFYIRDSIYPDPSGPVYHYDPARPQHDARYSKKIVFKEFDWLRYFANHITVVYPKGR